MPKIVKTSPSDQVNPSNQVIPKIVKTDQSPNSDVVLTDKELSDKAFVEIQKIYLDHTQQAYLQIANYLLETFFDNNIELIRKKTPANGKDKSFKMLCDRLRKEDSRLPKKSWLYNALGLLADEDNLKEDSTIFHAYGKLSVSHKVQLLPIHDFKKKKELIIETDKVGHSVRTLQKLVHDLRSTGKKKAVNPLKQLEKLKSRLEEDRKAIQLLIDSQSENSDYKDTEKQLVDLIRSIDKMIEIQEKQSAS